MRRLTDKVGIDYIYGNFVSLNEPHKAVANKLGQLEDILEKYEIDDINVLDKVLENQRFLSNHDYSTLPRKDFDELFEKLNKYKTIEEELGIDLITIWKAKTGTFCFKNNLGKLYPVMFQSIDHITKRIHFTILNEVNIMNSSAALKDYGKTWALTKKELE